MKKIVKNGDLPQVGVKIKEITTQNISPTKTSQQQSPKTPSKISHFEILYVACPALTVPQNPITWKVDGDRHSQVRWRTVRGHDKPIGVVSHLLSLQGVVKSPNVQQTNLKKKQQHPKSHPITYPFFLHPKLLIFIQSFCHFQHLRCIFFSHNEFDQGITLQRQGAGDFGA